MDLGAPELLIILVIALLIFGSNRLPKLARSLGQASREFRAGTEEGFRDSIVDSPPAAPVAPVAPVAPAANPAASSLEPSGN